MTEGDRICDCKMDLNLFFDLHALQYQENQNQRQRHSRVYGNRVDPRLSMRDQEFKRHFRLSKDSVTRLCDMLEEDLSFGSNRGMPISPIVQICITLNHYAGGHFQRISGWCAGVSQNGARLSLQRVTEALVRRKGDFVYMPDSNTMQETAERMEDKFNLPRFAFAVDGCQVKFTNAPRKLPPNKVAQMFWCRKQYYSINVQVVGNDKFIYDLDVGWPGSTHDARVWSRSLAKRHIEQQKRFLLAGDSGYPTSENLVKPYSTAESANDPRKRLFNRRLSGLRTMMSECLYGVWKARFPILKNLRTDFPLSQKIVVATAVLFNIARTWHDEDVGGEEDEEDGDSDREDDVLNNVVVHDAAQAHVRMRGKILRDRLKDEMPP